MLNKYSSRITQPASQGASQAMLIATGLKPQDLDKPQVGICSVWYEGNPCNMHLNQLGEDVKLDIVSTLEAYGQQLAGKITELERKEIVRYACPGAGACGGMYTANTMASFIEALGLSMPDSSSIPAEDTAKQGECFRA